MDPRYLKDVTVGSSASTIFTVVSVSFVGLGKYSVFVLLIFSPCLSNTTLHVSRSSSTSSRVIAYSTRSSANIIAQGGSFSTFSIRTSIIIMNKRGLRADPWCNPTSIGKYSVSPFCVTTYVLLKLYMSCTILTYSSGTPFFLPQAPPDQIPWYSMECLPFLGPQRPCVNLCSFLYTSPVVASMQRLAMLLTSLVWSQTNHPNLLAKFLFHYFR